MEQVRSLAAVFRPNIFHHIEPDALVMLAAVGGGAMKITGDHCIRHVFVKPTGTVDWPSGMESGMEALDGTGAVSFFMVVSTASEYLFESRPSEDCVAKLVELFGRDPCWMEDAMKKEEWHGSYGFLS